MPECPATNMFWALPTMVATLPTLAPMATARRNGTGGYPSPAVASSTSGVSSRQIVSFTNSAERTPATTTPSVSSVRGACARTSVRAASQRKNPARRRCATTTIMPNSSARVWKSTAATACAGVSTPAATIAVTAVA